MSATEPTLSTDELKLLALREKKAIDKRGERERKAVEKATAAIAPNPSGYVVPSMPSGLSGVRQWVRRAHDAYSRRQIGVVELAEIRRSASTLGDLYRVGAEIRKAEAAIRAAIAQESMAATLAQVEHGGAALLMLSRLQEGLTEGNRRPLPARVLTLPTHADGQEPA
jgi:hypothetical protein